MKECLLGTLLENDHLGGTVGAKSFDQKNNTLFIEYKKAHKIGAK